MAIRDGLLPEYDHEMATTRRTLERVPEGKSDWRPHEKSMTLGRLAGHLAEIPGWCPMTLEQDSFETSPADGPAMQPVVMTSRSELLELFDKNVAAGREALSKVSDEALMKPWALLAGGKKMMELPRIAVLRGFILNHSIHHRAQLGVYLRLNNVPVPSVYGPSADENPFAAAAAS
jgi:uncharacterized damage-inducible protein DinB